MADYTPRFSDDEYHRQFGDMYDYRMANNSPQQRDEIVDAYQKRADGNRAGLSEGLANVGGSLDNFGTLAAGALDRIPIGAAVNWADRHTGNNLAKLDANWNNYWTGENLSAEGNRKKQADAYKKAAEANPEGAISADIGAAFLDPTAKIGILGKATGLADKATPLIRPLVGGAAYNIAGDYANAAAKADSAQKPVEYGFADAAKSGAAGAGIGLAGHAVLNNPGTRRAIDWLRDGINKGRSAVADRLQTRRPLAPEEAAENIALKKSFDDNAAAAQAQRIENERRAGIFGDEAAQAVAAGQKPRIRVNPQNLQRAADYDALAAGQKADELLKPHIDAAEAAQQNYSDWNNRLIKEEKAAKREGRQPNQDILQGYVRANRDVQAAQDALNGRRGQIADVQSLMENLKANPTPTEEALSRVNPALRYGRDTGAKRGRPDFASGEPLTQARAVLKNANAPLGTGETPARAMWQTDAAIRGMNYPQEPSENLFSRAARGTEDKITGTGRWRTPEQMLEQDRIARENIENMAAEAASGRRTDTALGGFIRGSQGKTDPLKNWTLQEREDLERLTNQPEYAAQVLSGKAEMQKGGLTAAQQRQIAEGLRVNNSKLGTIMQGIGEYNLLTTATALSAPHFTPLGAIADRFLSKTGASLGQKGETAFAGSDSAIRRRLDKVLPGAVPGTGRFRASSWPERRAAGMAAAGYSGYNGIAASRPAYIPDDIYAKKMPAAEAAAYLLGQHPSQTQAKNADANAGAANAAQGSGGGAAQSGGQGSIYAGGNSGGGQPWQKSLNGYKGLDASTPAKRDFWNGFAQILAGAVGAATGTQFDYGINDKIASLQNDYGMSPQAARAAAFDPEAYNKLVAQKEAERDKERAEARKGGGAQKLEFKQLNDGRLVALDPYSGEIVREIGNARGEKLAIERLPDGSVAAVDPYTGDIRRQISGAGDKTRSVIAEERAKTAANESGSGKSLAQGLRNLDNLSRNITIGGGLGATAGRAFGANIYNREAYNDFNAALGHVKNMLTLDARKALKGQGAISDKETEMLANAETMLNSNLSQGQFYQEVRRLQEITQKADKLQSLGYKTAPDGTFLTREQWQRGEMHGARGLRYSEGGKDYAITEDGIYEVQ